MLAAWPYRDQANTGNVICQEIVASGIPLGTIKEALREMDASYASLFRDKGNRWRVSDTNDTKLVMSDIMAIQGGSTVAKPVVRGSCPAL
jgi:hypothetical protein